MNLRQAAQQALKYMRSVGPSDMYPEEWAIAVALEQALAEPPCKTGASCTNKCQRCAEPEQEPLTDEEIQTIWAKTFEMGSSANTFARAIEKAHNITGENNV